MTSSIVHYGNSLKPTKMIIVRHQAVCLILVVSARLLADETGLSNQLISGEVPAAISARHFLQPVRRELSKRITFRVADGPGAIRGTPLLPVERYAVKA